MATQHRHLIELGPSQRNPVTRELMPNTVRNFDGFHLSLNRQTADYGCATTAIVLQGRVFFVLNGNHAAELVQAAEQNGVQGCVDYFIDHIDEANHRSEHLMATQQAVDPFQLYPTTLSAIGQDNIDRIVAAVARPLAS